MVSLPTPFLYNCVPKSSPDFSLGASPLKIEPIRCHETSARNYRSALRNITEDQRSLQLPEAKQWLLYIELFWFVDFVSLSWLWWYDCVITSGHRALMQKWIGEDLVGSGGGLTRHCPPVVLEGLREARISLQPVFWTGFEAGSCRMPCWYTSCLTKQLNWLHIAQGVRRQLSWNEGRAIFALCRIEYQQISYVTGGIFFIQC
jgi:hypothetical protein